MLLCQECGHAYTKKDFEALRNLCEHLYLDALASTQKTTPPKPVSEGGGSALKDCPRCQGFMRAESFVDWTTNRIFGGWRCLTCGNVWDPGIAVNRSRGGKTVEHNTPRNAGYSIAMTIRSKKARKR